MSDLTEMGMDFDPSLKAAVYPAETKVEDAPVNPKAEAPKFKPFAGTPVSEVKTAPKVQKPDDVRLSEMEQMIKQVLAAQNRPASAPQQPLKELDFAKLDESSVYDLSIPIQAIEHGLPESMKVELADPNYVARWVHTHPKRLGPMKAVGFTTVTHEDLAADLNLSIEPDENGAYRFVDVILMKCPKSKYFGQLRRNHMNAVNAVKPDRAHAAGKAAIENYLKQEGGNDYVEAHDANKMTVYTPGSTL